MAQGPPNREITPQLEDGATDIKAMGVHQHVYLFSIAISLKRIADTMERIDKAVRRPPRR